MRAVCSARTHLQRPPVALQHQHEISSEVTLDVGDVARRAGAAAAAPAVAVAWAKREAWAQRGGLVGRGRAVDESTKRSLAAIVRRSQRQATRNGAWTDSGRSALLLAPARWPWLLRSAAFFSSSAFFCSASSSSRCSSVS